MKQNKHTDLKYRVNQKKVKTKIGKLDNFERLCDSDKGLPSSKLTNPPSPESNDGCCPDRDVRVPQ